MNCSCLTKKKNPCPIEADRCREGIWYCHVHDPWGINMKNINMKRKARKSREENRQRNLKVVKRPVISTETRISQMEKEIESMKSQIRFLMSQMNPSVNEQEEAPF